MSIKATEGRMTGPDVGYGAGTWSADIPGQNGGASTHIMGTFLSVIEREGSDWKFQADTWNMMPPTQPQKEATQ
jgi:ketosteroid isomerase-like protein